MTTAATLPPIIIASHAYSGPARHAYAIAGQTVCTDQPLGLAERYRIEPPATSWIEPAIPHDGTSSRLIESEGWLAGARRWVRCLYHAQGFTLQVADADFGPVDVETGLLNIRHPDRRSAGQPRGLEEVLLGPALILALARHSIFFLHAGAAQTGGAVVAFCAESGVGKSTLAGRPGPDWTPVVDDLLPLRQEDGMAWVLPGFPQFKWPPERQYPLSAPAATPLRALCQLAPMPPEGPDVPLRAERLGQRDATLTLIRHTVSGRLFSPALLEQHLRFCSGLSRTLPVYRLHYPKRFTVLPALRALIRELAQS